jgi:septal ring factor EnvC (AmiA/AmiB activator)
MSPIPDQLTAKLQQTADDAAALTGARVELVGKQSAEQTATQERQGAEAAVTSDLTTLQGDKAELKALIEAAFPDQPAA